MQLVCRHDPKDPDHLICEMKRSPLAEWATRRWRKFYCVGPTCPPHKAYGHLWVDVILALSVVVLVACNVILNARYRRVTGQRQQTVEATIEELARIPSPPPPAPSPAPPPAPTQFLLEVQARYFSPEGEQVGRGPWPPQAGERTTVTVALKPLIEGAFEDVVVRGVLAPAAKWTGFAPIGRGLSYEPSTRQVRFDVDGNASAVFEVAVTPTQADLEKGTIFIMADITLSGRDEMGTHREIGLPHLLLTFE